MPPSRYRAGGLREQEQRLGALLDRVDGELATLRSRHAELAGRLQAAREAGRSLAALEPAQRAVATALAQREQIQARYRAALAQVWLDQLGNRLQLLLDQPPAQIVLDQFHGELRGHSNSVLSVAFSPDGRTLASSSHDQTVRLWDVASGRSRGKPLRGHTNSVCSVAFSPDGRTLASGSDDQTVRLWDAATGRPRHLPLLGHTGNVNSVAFSPDGRTLASGSGRTVRLWDVATGKPRGELRGHTNWSNSVAFSPDGRTLASGSDLRTVRLWDVATGKPRGEALLGHTGDVNSVAFSPDGRTLASGSYDRTVRLWDVEVGLPGGPEAERALALLEAVGDLADQHGIRERAAATARTALAVCGRLTAARLAAAAKMAHRGEVEQLLADLTALAERAGGLAGGDLTAVVDEGRATVDALPARVLAPLVTDLTERVEATVSGLGRATSADCDRRLTDLTSARARLAEIDQQWRALPERTQATPLAAELRQALDELARRLPELEDLVVARQAVAEVAGVQPLADSEALVSLREQRRQLEAALRGPTAAATLEVESLLVGAARADGFVAAPLDVAARAAALDAIEAEYARLQSESEVLEQFGDA